MWPTSLQRAFRWFPEQASTFAGQVDALFLFLVAVTAVFTGLIFFLVFVFVVKFRRKAEDERPRPIHGSLPLELLWTLIPLGITMIIFVWGAYLYFAMTVPPGHGHGGLRRGQAMDVEAPASGGPARDQ
jgi:cytochrome c oxidase subunit 2